MEHPPHKLRLSGLPSLQEAYENRPIDADPGPALPQVESLQDELSEGSDLASVQREVRQV